jgi:IS30 family transposase
MPGKHKNRRSLADPLRPRGQHLSERERTQIITLYTIAKWNKTQIARELRLARSTVGSCIRSGKLVPTKPPGRKLSSQKRAAVAETPSQMTERRPEETTDETPAEIPEGTLDESTFLGVSSEP